MIHLSYEMAGTILIIFLAIGWIVSVLQRRKQKYPIGLKERAIAAGHGHEIEHRALMFLMAQKTDAILAALAKTIELERQKLGDVVSNPSMDDALVAYQAQSMAGESRFLKSGQGITTPSRPVPPVNAGTSEFSLQNRNQDLSFPQTNADQSPYDQVIHLADAGFDIPSIANQLRLPEAEVSMVLRLRAA